MKIGIAVIAALTFSSQAPGRVEDEKHFVDKARAASIHKLAVISITGPASFRVELSKIDSRDVVNEVEPKLVTTLQGGGFTVAPLADTKAMASANWQNIYYDNLPENVKEQGRAKGMTPEQQLQALKNLNAAAGFLRNASSNLNDDEGNLLATPTTIIVEDYADTRSKHAGDDVRIYGPVFCKTMGELAHRLGADAAVIVKAEPGVFNTGGFADSGKGSATTKKTSSKGFGGNLARSIKEPLGGNHPEMILHVVMIDQTGEYVFGEKLYVTADKSQGVGSITLHYDASKTSAGIREATDTAMSKLLERFPK
ncbi:MAG: hypothetical protein KGN84_10380 [Acidobacteriota bacterium]|nr:hypothetical protein [Acidobacteriota bacterium]